MSSTFRYHSQVNEVVPANATYTFPTQSTKINKQTVKLVPKNGGTYTSGNVVRIEFPSDNYLNVLNSVLQFDATVERAPVFVSGIQTATSTDLNTYGITGAVNSEYVVTLVTAVGGSGGTAAASVAAQQGAYSTTFGALNGCVLCIHRGGLTYSSTIAFHDVGTKTISSATYAQSVFYLTSPLPCGPMASGDVVSVHYPNVWQRGGAHNAIKRVRILYGSLPLEDIYEYKTLVRILFECGVQRDFSESHGQISEGQYCASAVDFENHGIAKSPLAKMSLTSDVVSTLVTNAAGISNVSITGTELVRAHSHILGHIASNGTEASKNDLIAPIIVSNTGVYSAGYQPSYNFGSKTYTLNLLSGLFSQKKLIPLKWMAAQLVIELTIATAEDALLSTTTTNAATLRLSNINYIAEMLEFDSMYDQGFYDGLVAGGIPLKFSTFHFHTFNITGTSQVFQIHERSRSVKSALAVIRTTQPNSLVYDSDWFFSDVGATFNTTHGNISDSQEGTLDTFQWRVGGRYYPAQPVRCQFGGAEAMLELNKVLNNLGDYTRGSQITQRNWMAGKNGLGGKFVISCEFENTDVFPDTIAGINAEEQSDIALTVISDPQFVPVNKKIDIFMHIDAMMIVRDGNIVDLVI